MIRLAILAAVLLFAGKPPRAPPPSVARCTPGYRWDLRARRLRHWNCSRTREMATG